MSNHTNRKQIVQQLKSDNANAQRVRCGYCYISAAQFPGGISDKNVVSLPDRKFDDDDTNAPGLMCNECLKHEDRVDEGPKHAVEIGPDGLVRERVKESIPMAPKVAKELAKAAMEIAKETGTTAPIIETPEGYESVSREGGATTGANASKFTSKKR